jgi:hypothetical protein
VRDRTETAIRIDLAACLVFSVTAVFSNINTIDSLERARELCRGVDDDANLSEFSELWRSSTVTDSNGKARLA